MNLTKKRTWAAGIGAAGIVAVLIYFLAAGREHHITFRVADVARISEDQVDMSVVHEVVEKIEGRRVPATHETYKRVSESFKKSRLIYPKDTDYQIRDAVYALHKALDETKGKGAVSIIRVHEFLNEHNVPGESIRIVGAKYVEELEAEALDAALEEYREEQARIHAEAEAVSRRREAAVEADRIQREALERKANEISSRAKPAFVFVSSEDERYYHMFLCQYVQDGKTKISLVDARGSNRLPCWSCEAPRYPEDPIEGAGDRTPAL
jgi:hypothetical protein